MITLILNVFSQVSRGIFLGKNKKKEEEAHGY
jgi:hypothetical protein